MALVYALTNDGVDEWQLIEVLSNRYRLECFQDYRLFLDAIRVCKPNLILINSQIKMINAEQIILYLKEHSHFYNIPIIVIDNSLGYEDTIINYLEIGVDDYLYKTFKPGELLFSIKRLLKDSQQKRIRFGDIYINQYEREVYVKEEKVNLTNKEFQLLSYFCSRNNRIVTRRELANNLWETSILDSRTLDMHVSTLRNKVFAKSCCRLLTVVKIGYQIKYEQINDR